jgi:hypothetical protein
VGTQRAELCEKDRGTQLQAQLGVQVQKLRNLRDKPRNLALATSANRFDCLYSKRTRGLCSGCLVESVTVFTELT